MGTGCGCSAQSGPVLKECGCKVRHLSGNGACRVRHDLCTRSISPHVGGLGRVFRPCSPSSQCGGSRHGYCECLHALETCLDGEVLSSGHVAGACSSLPCHCGVVASCDESPSDPVSVLLDTTCTSLLSDQEASDGSVRNISCMNVPVSAGCAHSQESCNANSADDVLGNENGSISREADDTVGSEADDRVRGEASAKLSFLCWNIDGLASKLEDTDFLRYVSDFDIVCLGETFVGEGLGQVHNARAGNTPTSVSCCFKGFDTYMSSAVKLSHHGRKSGGLLVLVKKEISDSIEKIEAPYDHIIVLKLRKCLVGGSRDVIVLCTYVPPVGSPYYTVSGSECHLHEVEHCIADLMLSHTDCHLVLCGDMNARTGDFQICRDRNIFDDLYQGPDPSIVPGELFSHSRVSDDTKCNGFGKILLDVCACFDLSILNGFSNVNESSVFTFMSDQGCSTIDYCISSHEFIHRVVDLCVGTRVESPHMPLEFKICIADKPAVCDDSTPVEKLFWCEDKVNSFIQNISSDEFQQSIHDACSKVESDIDQALATFTESLKAAACGYD